MPLIELLSDKNVWERFYRYKASLECPKRFTKELRAFIDAERYLPVCESVRRGESFPLPRKTVISKQFSEKKRTVYTYPEPENTVLKLLTYLLSREYDGIFSDGLYSFRPRRTAKDAIRKLATAPGMEKMYAYKADVSDYFNSVPIEKLLPVLEKTLRNDPGTYAFLSRLLREERVLSGGRELIERKGIMAGTPLSAFYANLYLAEMDEFFEHTGMLYARYSDDIVVFDDSPEKVHAHAQSVRGFLDDKGLAINEKKEFFFAPSEGWSFLGFDYRQGVTDIAASSLDKIKHKMRRKARALERWQKRNALSGEKAAKAFIRIFNRKLFESPEDSELSWCRWYFPLINTDESLKVIDHYAQDCVRFLATGTRTKARFNLRYEDMKRLGYRSLVNAYYGFEG